MSSVNGYIIYVVDKGWVHTTSGYDVGIIVQIRGLLNFERCIHSHYN